jgi:hypothetical protein
MAHAIFAPGSRHENRVGIRPRRKAVFRTAQVDGWQWIEGDMNVPYLTERENFREVLLKSCLAAELWSRFASMVKTFC